MKTKSRKTEFDIALSFAGENRVFVEKVAIYLKKMGYSVFYDKYEKVTLWGKDLFEHLSKIYYELSTYTVMFISKHYAKKLWTNHERKNAQARAFESNKEYVLPVRFDNSKIPGILPTTGYLDLSDISPKELAELIKQKIGYKLRYNFVPEELDVLNNMLGAKKAKDKAVIKYLAGLFIDSLKLMTKKEREIPYNTASYSCPAGPPEDIHINLDYLSRIIKMDKKEIISLFARLECININSRVTNLRSKCKGSAHSLNEKEILSIKFEPMTTLYAGNATLIAYNIFKCLENNICPNCCLSALDRLDFSILSSLAGFPEKHK
jgi:hypothetical protein